MDARLMTAEIHRAQHRFTIEMVETAQQYREMYQLRYQVYCRERNLLPGADGEERDEYDSHSRHILLRSVGDHQPVGTVRMVGPKQGDLSNSFPMLGLCEPARRRKIPLQDTGEVSRFAISKHRRMSYEDVSLLRLALVRGLVQLSEEMGLTHWIAVMEPSLMRLNQRNAIYFEPIGPLVDYHGMRQPAMARLDGLLDRVRREQLPTWNYLTNGGQFHPHRQLWVEAA